MSKSETTQLTLDLSGRETDEPANDEDKRPCIHDWCDRLLHKNGWARHIRGCQPPAGWDGGDE